MANSADKASTETETEVPLEETPSASSSYATKEASRKKVDWALCRHTCFGNVYLSDQKEKDAVRKAKAHIEKVVQEQVADIKGYDFDGIKLEEPDREKIGDSVVRVATDLVAWFVHKKLHPEDPDEAAEQAVGAFLDELQSAAECKGVLLTSVMSDAQTYAEIAVSEYLLDIHPEGEKIKAFRKKKLEDFLAFDIDNFEVPELGWDFASKPKTADVGVQTDFA